MKVCVSVRETRPGAAVRPNVVTGSVLLSNESKLTRTWKLARASISGCVNPS
jgi:hypothetical protein